MAVTFDMIDKFQNEFEKKKKYTVLQGVLRKTPLNSVSGNQNALSKLPLKFNTVLPDVGATNQYNSGRCWIFAGLNVIRQKLIHKYKLDGSFELSQSYLSRFDKLEKCNATLEFIYDLAKSGKSNMSLEYAALISNSLSDGGTWPSFVALVKKYGVVPKDVYPDTFQAKNTGRMCALLETIIMRTSHSISVKMPRSEFDDLKNKTLDECYRVINMFMSNAPKSFMWSAKQERAEKSYTPLSFYGSIVKPLFNPDKFVCISHFPLEKYDSLLGVEYTNTVLDRGNEVTRNKADTYLNIDLDTFKTSVYKAIVKGFPVWFACDFGKFLLESHSVLDQNSSNLVDMLDIDFDTNKRIGLESRTIIPNHAMVITGVHKTDKGFERWRVENSHGSKNPFKGSLVMSDKWFSEFVICAAVPIDCLPVRLRDFTKLDTKWLPFWSVLGTFSRS